MFNYIKAEMYRVFKKKSLYILMLLSTVVYSGMNFLMNNDSFNTGKLLEGVINLLNFGVIVVGIYIFTAIYNDDFSSKSMQASIGYGIERSKLVFFKFMSALLLTVLMFAFLTVVFFINLKVLGFGLNSEEIRIILAVVIGSITKIIIICAIAGIFSFFSQKGIPGTIVFVLLVAQVIDLILNMVLSLEPVVSLIGDRTGLLLVNVINSLQEVIVTGNIVLLPIVASIVYIVGPLVITMLTFKNRELEF